MSLQRLETATVNSYPDNVTSFTGGQREFGEGGDIMKERGLGKWRDGVREGGGEIGREEERGKGEWEREGEREIQGEAER